VRPVEATAWKGSGAGAVLSLPCVRPFTIGPVPLVASGALFALALLAMATLLPFAGFAPLVLFSLACLPAVAILPLTLVTPCPLVCLAAAQLLMVLVGPPTLELIAFPVGEALTLVPVSVFPFGVVLGVRLLAGHGGSASRVVGEMHARR
jgi:hypothetical protein